MANANLAANGLRFRMPYATLLYVNDKSFQGEIKISDMAKHFYREWLNTHLKLGIWVLELLRAAGTVQLDSRRLRRFAEVAYQ
jgi:AMP nucleosidase